MDNCDFKRDCEEEKTEIFDNVVEDNNEWIGNDVDPSENSDNLVVS